MLSFEQLIEDLTEDSVSLASCMRKLLVVASRANSEPLSDWISHELDGYPDGAELPQYRLEVPFRLRLTFVGYGFASKTVTVDPIDIPKQLRAWEEQPLKFRQSLTEIEAFTTAEFDPYIELSKTWCAQHQRLSENGQALCYTSMYLDAARMIISKDYLKALLGRVRTDVLRLVLELERAALSDDSNPSIGQVKQKEAHQVINLFVGNMYGGVNLGNGDQQVVPIDEREQIQQSSFQLNQNYGTSINNQGDQGDFDMKGRT